NVIRKYNSELDTIDQDEKGNTTYVVVFDNHSHPRTLCLQVCIMLEMCSCHFGKLFTDFP
ncbi:unnamed protein product, partial [Callosobruchus maculatus]